MSDNEEAEIKIEYIESFEIDPLCENSEKPRTCDTKFSLTSNDSDENINQHVTNNEEDFVENNESTINNDNLNPEVSENEETWYKSIDKSGRYLCKYCDHSYSTIQTIRHHVKNKHKDYYDQIKETAKHKIRKSKLKCHICNIRFKRTNNLQEHIQIHGINNIQQSCFICHATFNIKAELETHFSLKHKSVLKPTHFCNICGYSTTKLSHFKQHKNTHSQEKQIKCSHCEYSTNYLSNMTIHERTHTNNKPYICSIIGCGYRCATRSGLSSHRLKHEKEKNIVYCDKCSYSTVYKQSLRKHLDSHRRNCVRTRF